MDELLRMEHVSKRFGDFYANRDINLSVRKGEVHTLWGENADGTGYRRTIKELADTLRDYGAEEMFLRSRGSLRVRMDLADSDFQAFMSGDEDAICQFQGVFMQQYSWAEPMVCTLQEKKELMLARMGKHRM